MNTIKFRAWDRDTMWGVREIDFDIEQIYIGLHYEEMFNVKIMQYTGLKDKNGTEIYENDILSDDKYTYRVYGLPGGFAIKAPHWSEDKTDLKTGDELVMQPLADVQTRQWVKDNCTIIGNIHETK